MAICLSAWPQTWCSCPIPVPWTLASRPDAAYYKALGVCHTAHSADGGGPACSPLDLGCVLHPIFPTAPAGMG